MGEGEYQAIWSKMKQLDEGDIYYYSHKIDTDIEIPNPLSASSFLDSNHPYREFTICQLDTATTDIYITNKVR
jgi:hypothetical protein